MGLYFRKCFWICVFFVTFFSEPGQGSLQNYLLERKEISFNILNGETQNQTESDDPTDKTSDKTTDVSHIAGSTETKPPETSETTLIPTYSTIQTDSTEGSSTNSSSPTTEGASSEQPASSTDNSSPTTEGASSEQPASSTDSSSPTTKSASSEQPTTTGTTSSEAPTISPTSKPPMPAGIVAIIVIGVTLFIIFLVGVVYYLMKKRNRRSEYTQPLDP